MEKTYRLITDYYTWTNMQDSIKTYIQTCETCQRMKTIRAKPKGLLQPLEIADSRWSQISIDFITKLPVSKEGKNSILVITCTLTKRSHFIACKEDISAIKLAEIFLKEFVRFHGIPKSIISDRDVKFTSKFWKSLANLLEIELKMASSYHQQTNGQVERINHILCDYLRCYTNAHQSNWEQNLPLAEFAYNERPQKTIKMSPFEADLGYVPSISSTMTINSNNNISNESDKFIIKQTKILKMLRTNIKLAQERMKKYYDKKTHRSTI